jgi:hypothetical protein
MALELDKTGINTGDDILPGHVTQSIDALTGDKEYDITISGSLSLKGTTSTPQDDVLTIDTQTGKIHHIPKTSLIITPPTPTIPTLQEVTTAGSSTNKELTTVDINSSGTITASSLVSTGNISASGTITASSLVSTGNISASGHLFIAADQSSTVDKVALYNDTTGEIFYTSSDAFGGGDSLWTVDSSNSDQINYEGFIAPSIKSTSSSSIAIGHDSLKDNGTAENNIGIGREAGNKNTGTDNIFIGHKTSKLTVGGNYNTILGSEVFLNNTTSNYNTILGYKVSPDKVSSQKNVYLGASINSSQNSNTENEIIIGYGTTGVGSHSVRLGNSTIKNIEGNVTFVAASDSRIKNNVTEYKLGLDFIKLLSPKYYNKVNPADYPDPILEERFTGNNPEARPDDDTDIYDGLLAQDVKTALETLSETSKIHSENINGMQGISYSLLVLPLIKAVQELSSKIDNIETQLANQSDPDPDPEPTPSPSLTNMSPQQAEVGETVTITFTGQNLNADFSNSTQMNWSPAFSSYQAGTFTPNGNQISFEITIDSDATLGEYNIGTRADSNEELLYTGGTFEILASTADEIDEDDKEERPTQPSSDYIVTTDNTTPGDASTKNVFWVDGPQASNGPQPNIGAFEKLSTNTFYQANYTDHPFSINTTGNFTDGNMSGVTVQTANGTNNWPPNSALITLTVPSNSPDTLYYYCASHSGMGGEISIFTSSGNDNVGG